MGGRELLAQVMREQLRIRQESDRRAESLYQQILDVTGPLPPKRRAHLWTIIREAIWNAYRTGVKHARESSR